MASPVVSLTFTPGLYSTKEKGLTNSRFSIYIFH